MKEYGNGLKQKQGYAIQSKSSSTKANSPDAPQADCADEVAVFDGSSGILICLGDPYYSSTILPQCKELWKGRNDHNSKSASIRADAIFKSFKKRLEKADGKFYKPHNPRCNRDQLYRGENLYAVSDKEAITSRYPNNQIRC